MALIHFAITLFVSAFILFLVQPLIGKLVLPKLGGTPQVWNTCMVFFQMVLLLGYFYTHAVSTRLKPRAQILLHCTVILVPFLVFWIRPFWFIKDWDVPNLGGNPIFPTLFLLSTVVGIPFFVVSTTAPLLQKWFALTGHSAAKDPYFLYGASNLGSMLSLLAYPAGIEPFTYLNTQAILWMAGFAVLVFLVFGCVAMVWKPSGQIDAAEREAKAPETSPNPVSGEIASTAIQTKPSSPKAGAALQSAASPQIETLDGWRRFRWIMLAAIPSSMMLGVTSHITTDLSPIPLFWLVPLAFYLLSFILVFARWPVVWVDTPHTIMVLLQPIAIVLMVLFNMIRLETVWPAIAFNTLGFVLTVMVCHGELAKDRPSVRFLTDFYLMMSVGGMVGGMLNALVAPLIPYVFELNLAIIAGCLIRPNLPFGNWLDRIVGGMADRTPEPQQKGKGKHAPQPAIAAATSSGPGVGLDIIVGVGVLIIAFVVNMMFARNVTRDLLIWVYFFLLMLPLLFFARGLRFGLAIAGIILAYEIYATAEESSLVRKRSRSYFGHMKVMIGQDRIRDDLALNYLHLMHGHIDHGRNYMKSDPDFSRLATTYYHRKGPVGIVMEKFNWFPDSVSNNTFWADNRMPASLVGTAAMDAMGLSLLPTNQLVDAWSEPPYATIGLGTGTMASYGRPFQHVHFYEIDDQVKRFSLPEGHGDTYFTYLQDALDRGAAVQVLMGDARQRMNLPYRNFYEKSTDPQAKPPGGPENFYHMMVVDAFSSDAIPAHLLTKEAFEMYFKHLTQDGVLCVHTSNRFVDLPRVVADVAESLDLVCLVGNDNAPNLITDRSKKIGHYMSEWVMVARKPPRGSGKAEREYLKHLVEPTGYRQLFKSDYRRYWKPPETYNGKYLWTDDYYNLLNILTIFVDRHRD